MPHVISTKTSKACGLCGASLVPYAPTEPASYACTSCGLVQLGFASREQGAAWEAVYGAGHYHRERVLDGFDSFEKRLDHDLRLARLRLENLSRFVAGGRLLDVGTGNGALVKMARQYGFFPIGIDPDPWAVKKAKELMPQLPVQVATFDAFTLSVPDNSFEIVTFIDSFEHMLNPHSVMTQNRRILVPGGLLLVEMPDADCPAFAEQCIGWKHFKPAEHAYLWGRRHMECLLRMYGFSLIDTIVPYPDRRVYYATGA